jgi:hypothetical protein
VSKGDQAGSNGPGRRRVALGLGLLSAVLTTFVLFLLFGVFVGGVLAVFMVPALLVVLAAVARGRDDPS